MKSRLLTNLRDALGVALGRKSVRADAWLRGGDVSPAGGAQITEPMSQSVWVYACVNAISQAVSNTPIRITRDQAGGEDTLDTGPLVDLLTQPHPYQTKFELFETLVCWLMLRGESYLVGTEETGAVVPLRDRRATDKLPTRLLVINADRVRKLFENGSITGYAYSVSALDDPFRVSVLLPSEAIFLRLPNPFAFWDGLSPLTVASLAATTDYAASAVMKGLMLNNADSGVTVRSEGPLSEDQRNQVRAALRERKRQAGTADRPLILEGLTVEKPSVSMADMQFLENRKFSRQEICAVYGVPQELIGFTEDANRSVSESARYNFIEHRISPLCSRISAALTPLAQAFSASRSDTGRLYIWFDIDSLPIMAASRRARVDTAVKLWGMGYPANDINDTLDLGLPSIPGGDVGYLPFSVAPVGESQDLPSYQPAPSDQSDRPDPSDPSDPSKHSADIFTRLSATLTPRAPAAPTHACMSSGAYLASIRGSVRLKERKLSRFFFSQRQRVLSALDKQPKTGDATTVTRAIRPEDIFDLDAETALLKAIIEPALIADLEFGGAQIWRELGAGAFNLPPSEAIEFIAGRQNSIRGINETTFDGIRDAISGGLQDGSSIEQMAAKVREVFTDATQHRAETIALTETNLAINTGRFTGMEEAGVDRKAWLSSNLEGSRPGHQAAGEQYADGILIDQPFEVTAPDGTVERLMYPMDPKGSPANTINCKCTILAVMGDKAVQPDRHLSFAEWMTGRAGRHQDAPQPDPVSSVDSAPKTSLQAVATGLQAP